MTVMQTIPSLPADAIRVENLSFKYPTRSATTHEAELRHIEQSLTHGFQRLTPMPLRDDTLSVVGFGPTLMETWQQITHPCITMSGSHDFLIEHGVIPDYHAQMDGREHQAKFLEHPQRETTYLMSTICHPAVWGRLAGHAVYLWHNVHGQHVVDWVGRYDAGNLVVAAGTHIGITTIHLGGLLGFRKFRLFGIDGHRLQDGKRHAGVHYDPNVQRLITRFADGRDWLTSPQMSNGCDEVIWMLRDNPALEIDIVGDSLLAAMVRDLHISKDYWERTLGYLDATWADGLIQQRTQAESLRFKADFNTGTIPVASAFCLRALVERIRPVVSIEIGTFIGISTTILAASGQVYTCDKDNDCLPNTERIHCHPKTTSTVMLERLVREGVHADLMFFDGRIQPQDIALILRCSKPSTVYAFDDYIRREKGVCNVELLEPFLPRHRFVQPPTPERTAQMPCTVALLVPA